MDVEFRGEGYFSNLEVYLDLLSSVNPVDLPEWED